ncbi:MAG: NAD(P)-binding domain-containing protein, partial [Thermoanaerobaculum sp.]|nr:NAD(P)-binding domain-containing protein [Thermoanaerobaculum sp.]
MRVAIVGAGSWGTALAIHAARAGHQVMLWAREREVVEGICRQRRNPLFLSDFLLPEGVGATADLAEAVARAEVVVFVVPVQFARGVLRQLRGLLKDDVTFVSASKGIEVATLSRMDELVAQELALPLERFVALSGPTFAQEVARGLPAAAVLAGHSVDRLEYLQRAFSTPQF